ncbi:MAG TPA: YkgJ family cysteine cluster protein [Polyangia bacterium]|nr:YkgJ family cysteine cluster protein [Polyangia bacterium]
MQNDMSKMHDTENDKIALRMPAIEAIWIGAARELGWTAERTEAAYASTDGRGRLLIGVDEVLDSDDTVAQLIFHELCHGLVQGPAGWNFVDWGLSNEDARDVVAEHACLRLQVFLTEPYGLRFAMAPTTEYRAYHDAIAGHPLDAEGDAAAALARAAINRVESARWLVVLRKALAATRTQLAINVAESGDASARSQHPTGFAWSTLDQTCSTCAWFYRGGRGPAVERCRQSSAIDGEGERTMGSHRACVRWEATLDCQECGACCREAYHSVTVSVRDPVVWKQPDLIVRQGHRFEILREGPRCAALHDGRERRQPEAKPAQISSGERAPRALFACTIYEDRPRACRDFEAGGRHCLVARRRVGLSA